MRERTRVRPHLRANEAHGETAPALLPSGGRPIELAVREPMEQKFGHDFSAVRIHDDAGAAQAADALAYVAGNDVVFGEGQYAPETPVGQFLLAHELAHVVQQDKAPDALEAAPIVSHAGEPAETEADRAAVAVSAGQSPTIAEGPGAAVARFDDERDLMSLFASEANNPLVSSGDAPTSYPGDIEEVCDSRQPENCPVDEINDGGPLGRATGKVFDFVTKTAKASGPFLAKKLAEKATGIAISPIPFFNPIGLESDRNLPAEEHAREDRERNEQFERGLAEQQEEADDMQRQRRIDEQVDRLRTIPKSF